MVNMWIRKGNIISLLEAIRQQDRFKAFERAISINDIVSVVDQQG